MFVGAYYSHMLNLRAKITNHGFQSSETAHELGLLLRWGFGTIYVPITAGDTTRDRKYTFGLVPCARGARMASVAAHFAPAAIDAAPYLQAFSPVGIIGTIRFLMLQRHHFVRPMGRGFSRVSIYVSCWRDIDVGTKW